MFPASMIFSDPLIEPLPEVRQKGLHVKAFRKACVDFHWHFHPEIELVFVERGRGVRYVGRSVEPFSSGDFCLLGSDVPHAFGSDPADRQGAEWLVAHFLPEVWGAAFWELPEARSIGKLLRRAQQGIWFCDREAQGCLEKFRQLERAKLGASRLASWLEILDCLASLPDKRYLNPASSAKGDGRAIDTRIQRTLAWVEDHASDCEMTQAEAASEVHMSPQAFCCFFRGASGRAFHRYVNEVRIARACGYLLDSGKSISEIAFQSGFNNLSNFNRRFREITGKTPREYRQMEGGLYSLFSRRRIP